MPYSRRGVSICDAVTMGRPGVFAVEVWGVCGGWDEEVWYVTLVSSVMVALVLVTCWVRANSVEYSPGEFVYTTNYGAGYAAGAGSGSGTDAGIGTCTGTERGIGIGSTEVVPAGPGISQPDPFWSLSNEQKMLLHHFIHDASQITACHSGMQNDICRMLIPMALQTPSLLHATTALSAIHLQAVNNRSENVKAMPDIARFMALSLEHFRRELQDPASRGSEALLATARTLCLAEIHSGAVHPNSWRAHIEGAKVLMRTVEQNNAGGGYGFRWYLDRWYRSIVSLTALTANGPPIGEHASVEMEGSPDYLDDYWGFTVHLSAIFREIGAAAWQQRLDEQPLDPAGTKPDEASRLELSVRRLMAHTASSTPTFYPGVEDGLTSDCVREFMLCNEAFQHSALIQIQRRLRRTPSSSVAVQASVRRILECTMQIGPSSGLSPWVMLTTPLFIAGCEAHGEQREQARALLSMLHDTIRVPNVLQSLKFLEQYWREQMEEEGWCQYLGILLPFPSDRERERAQAN